MILLFSLNGTIVLAIKCNDLLNVTEEREATSLEYNAYYKNCVCMVCLLH